MVAGALERHGNGRKAVTVFASWIAAAVRCQEGRAFLWTPVALTLGIWAYFSLDTEPSPVGVAIAAGVGAIFLWFGRRLPVLLLIGALIIGFGLAKLRSDLAATPLLHATTGEVAVTGVVKKIDHASRRRVTILFAPDAIEGVAPAAMPRLLRLSAFEKHGVPMIGSRVSAKARLFPNPTPVEPGGFDYGRRLWFDGIGGGGRIIGPVTLLTAPSGWNAGLEAWLQATRDAMGARIRAHLDEPIASFAEALITGERATIPKDLNHSLLVSGLFHILSISGLHMWMVAGGVFWSVRALLALSPPLAVRFPIKKWAAATAVAMGWFYMMLTDSGVATTRSFIMIAVVFFAVMVNRPALSTRNLAIAAIIVLVLEPESAVEASFQMSFLAVLGLVAFYEAWSKRSRVRDPQAAEPPGWVRWLARKAMLATFLSIATTLVAGSMSSIPAAYHFGRLAPYGVVANGLAVPAIGILVMPPALLAAVLMPLGLEGPPLWVMGKGLELVILISDWVASFPGAHVVVAQPPALASAAIAAGAVILCLLAGPVRGLGLAIVAVGLALSLGAPAGADLMIERTAANVVLRNEEGLWVPAQKRRARFAVEKWLQTNGEEATLAEATKRPGWDCTEKRCTATVKGKRVAYLTGEGPATGCDGIDILIAAFPLRGACRAVALRIDRFDVWRSGAHAVRIGAGGVKVETARQLQGNRPWVVVPQARKRRTPQR
jgi:competence protein ComEC